MVKELNIIQGVQRYEGATLRAFWQEVFGHLRGKPARLLSFEDVRARLRLREESYRGLQDIPVDKIVGSVGRYKDFTSSFLPTNAVSRDRWSRIYAETVGAIGLPPIEVYQVGEVYFVRDGNHRVSVARELGYDTIQAYVTEVDAPACLSDLVLTRQMDAAEAYMTFLDQTGLRRMMEDDSIILSEPSRYCDLLGHINLHQSVKTECDDCPMTLEEAAAHWYENIYQPIVALMRQYNVLENAQERTEADMYLWLVDHLHELERQYKGNVDDLAPALVAFLQKRKLPVPEELLEPVL
jgi:hypothetical protein